jgi:hypothetical protein
VDELELEAERPVLQPVLAQEASLA